MRVESTLHPGDATGRSPRQFPPESTPYPGGSSVTQACTAEPTPLVLGYLDLPVDGEPLPFGLVEVRGWAVIGRQPALAAVAQVDGRPLGAGPVTVERQDVADYLGNPALAMSGFSFFIDTTDFADEGGSDLEVVVSVLGASDPSDPSGPRAFELGRSTVVAVNPGAAFGNPVEVLIDLPAEGVEIRRGPLGISGWALASVGPVSEVAVAVNSMPYGWARLGMPRPDVAEARRVAFAAVAGFEHIVDLTQLPADVHDVCIEVRASALIGSGEGVALRSVPLVAQDERLVPITAASPESAIVERSERLTRVVRERAHVWKPEPATNASSNDRLKLLVVTHELGLGGGQLWLSELLERSRAGDEYECTVIAFRGGVLHGRLERLGINVHVTSPVPVDDVDAYEGRIRELATLASRLGVNAVLSNTMLSFAGPDIASRLGLPCVWAIHESFSPPVFWTVAFPPDCVDPLVRGRVEELLAWAPAVVFEAEATRQLYLGHVPPEHALVVPYGISTTEIDAYLAKMTREQAREAHHLAPDQRVLLVMGTTEPRKSQIVLAEAFAQVAERHPEALLVFVGDNGSGYARALGEFIDASGASAQIRLEPVTPDIYSWYRAADVLVSSSDVESLPRSFLEAMCFGLPIASASVFGIPDLIDPDRTGFLFRARDLRAAVQALDHVLGCSSTQLEAIARAAREEALRSHDSAGYATSLIRLLEAQRNDTPARPGEPASLKARPVLGDRDAGDLSAGSGPLG